MYTLGKEKQVAANFFQEVTVKEFIFWDDPVGDDDDEEEEGGGW